MLFPTANALTKHKTECHITQANKYSMLFIHSRKV